MPLTRTDRRVLKAFIRRYGARRGKRIFYASINSGKVRNIPEARRMRRKRARSRKV